MRICMKLWREEDGVLSFEWTLLVTLLTIGIVSGLSAARDGIIDELGDAAQAMGALDQSFIINFPLEIIVNTVDPCRTAASSFSAALFYTVCGAVLIGPI